MQYSTVSVIGRSLGSGIASYVAAQRNVLKLVLVTPFDSITNLAQQSYPLYPIPLLLKDKYNSAGRAHKIKADVLVLVAQRDQIVGRKHSNKLIAAFVKQVPKVNIINGSTHNNISEYAEYYQIINEFL